jgi:hypothetical protein
MMGMTRVQAAYRLAIAAVLLLAVLAVPRPAEAYTITLLNQSDTASPPTFTFDKGSAPNGNLYVAFSTGSGRFRMAMPAGSGNGTSNTCTSNAGWLPNGTYSPVTHRVKTDGKVVVRGNVWQLPNKQCNGGTTVRTELFIRSNGIDGTPWDGNYKTEGCIKISQNDRSRVVSYALGAGVYQKDSEVLYVTA